MISLMLRKRGDELFLTGMSNDGEGEELSDDQVRDLLVQTVELQLTVTTMMTPVEFIERFLALRARSDVVEQQLARVDEGEICPIGALMGALERICVDLRPSEN